MGILWNEDGAKCRVGRGCLGHLLVDLEQDDMVLREERWECRDVPRHHKTMRAKTMRAQLRAQVLALGRVKVLSVRAGVALFDDAQLRRDVVEAVGALIHRLRGDGSRTATHARSPRRVAGPVALRSIVVFGRKPRSVDTRAQARQTHREACAPPLQIGGQGQPIDPASGANTQGDGP